MALWLPVQLLKQPAISHKGRIKMNTGREHKHKQKHGNYKLKAIWIDRKNKQKQKGYSGMNNMSRSRTKGRSNRSILEETRTKGKYEE
jgi:hypothetical protein